MPYRAHVPCGKTGCREYKPCPHHAHATTKTRTERGYDNRWLDASREYLRQHPHCQACQKNGVLERAAEVDHVKPHRGDQTLFWDRSNWQALCKKCHSRKTAVDTGGRAPSTLVHLVRPPTIPILVVAVPCTSLVLHHVRTQVTPDTLVLDVETLLATQTKQPLYVCEDVLEQRRAQYTRNQVLMGLGGVRPPSYRRLVFLTDAAQIRERRHWRAELRANVVVCAVPPDAAATLVRADAHAGKEKRCEAITRWWSRYANDEQDQVVTTPAAVDVTLMLKRGLLS